MPLKIIGTGVGRTGTYSLKLALNELGLGPCHHMEVVLQNMPVQVPLWASALDKRPDWRAIYKGHASAVDWPTAGFFSELIAVYPDAKFIHTSRSPKSWAQSFSETIYKLISARDKAPPEMAAWLDMSIRVIAKTGFPLGLDLAGLEKAFSDHDAAVKAAIPARQLLVYEVKDGWAPLCAFLGVPEVSMPFPRTNARVEFWDLVSKTSAGS